MGVFDESDDDDDDDEKLDTAVAGVDCHYKMTAAASAFASWPNTHEEEEQDKQPGKDNDEEEEEDPLDAYMKSLAQQQQQEPSSASSAAAAAAAASLQKRQQRFEDNDHSDDDDDDHDDDDDTFAKKSAQKIRLGEKESQQQQQQQQQQSSLLTTTWRKVFWTVQNTVQGRTWRANHDVSCSIAVDPIYNSFFNLIQKQEKQDDDDEQQHKNKKLSLFFSNEAFIHQTLHELGFQQPTIVQSQTMPVILSGMNVLVTAATGQGKTLAYAWPMMIHVMDQTTQKAQAQAQAAAAAAAAAETTGPIALILVPTRELALQVNKQVQVLFKAAVATATATTTTTTAASTTNKTRRPLLLTTRAVIGGVGKYILHQQLKKSGGVHVVVATPGRLLDVVLSDTSKKGLSLQRVTMLILDELDKMLSLGFETQVRQILSNLPKQHHQQHQQQQPLRRQTLMFSATLGGRRVEKVAKEWLSSSSSQQQSYVRIAVGQVGECSTSVQQHVMVLPHEQAKQSFIVSMLPTLQNVGRTLIFCATRHGCEHLARVIIQSNNNNNNNNSDNNNSDNHNSNNSTQKEGGGGGGGDGVVKLEIIHGERHQSDRVKALKAFTQGRVKVLIATDVAGRGLDVPNVATVINFDPAKNMDSHVHRIGRAGRLNKQDKKKASRSSTSSSNSIDDDDDEGDNDNDTTKQQQQQQQPQEGTAYTLLTPKNADFAHALRNALSRQGRPISQDLNDLANKSRKVAATGNNNDNVSRRSNRESSSAAAAAAAAAYYAPSQPTSESAPPQKRSPWV